MEGVTRRFRNIFNVETAAISAIVESVNPDAILSELWANYAVEEDFNCEHQNPEYVKLLHALREGLEFLMDITGPDWTPFRGKEVQPTFAMQSQCDRVNEPFPGDLAPFLGRLFAQDVYRQSGFEDLIVRLAKLQDMLPKHESSEDWQAKRERIAMPIRKHLHAEIAEAERVLADFLKPPFDYHAYLRSPEWKAKRDAQVEAAGGRCQVCNSPKQLNTHHRTYERIGNEIPDDLFVLCAECHQIFHDNGKLARWPAK